MTKNANYRKLTESAKTARVAPGEYTYKGWSISRIYFEDANVWAWVSSNDKTGDDLGDTCETKAEALYYTMVALGEIK